MSGALERIIGVGKGEAAVDGAIKSMTTTWLSRPCPDGAKKHVGGGAKWKDVLKRVKQEGSSAKARNNVVYRLCGDVGGVQLAGVATSGAKYAFGPTGSWWRNGRSGRTAADNPCCSPHTERRHGLPQLSRSVVTRRVLCAFNVARPHSAGCRAQQHSWHCRIVAARRRLPRLFTTAAKALVDGQT